MSSYKGRRRLESRRRKKIEEKMRVNKKKGGGSEGQDKVAPFPNLSLTSPVWERGLQVMLAL